MNRPTVQSPALRLNGDALISPLNKGLGPLHGATGAKEIASLGWNVLREDLSLPAAVLYREKLEHNLRWMQQFAEAYGARLAPHGKTTMAPRLFQMQMEAGAWGITLATAQQTLVAYCHGIRRVLMANQLVGRQNMSIIAELLRDPEFSFYCLVDSAEQVEQLRSFFAARGQRLQVLLELGVPGGRSGVRDEAQLETVLSALARAGETVLLSGVEVYEGILNDEASVRAFLRRAVEVTRRLEMNGSFRQAPTLLSGAGSLWYDVVAEAFSAAGFGDRVQMVLRPGCYITHDAGAYREAQARILADNPVARRMNCGLVPALHLWAYVHSVPEPGRAIVGLGRRDAAFDSGLPKPVLHFRPGESAPRPAPPHWSMVKIMDQHGYLEISNLDDLRSGDMIAFDICHPCLTFDKWRVIPIVDSTYRVVELVETFF